MSPTRLRYIWITFDLDELVVFFTCLIARDSDHCCLWSTLMCRYSADVHTDLFLKKTSLDLSYILGILYHWLSYWDVFVYVEALADKNIGIGSCLCIVIAIIIKGAASFLQLLFAFDPVPSFEDVDDASNEDYTVYRKLDQNHHSFIRIIFRDV